MNLLFIFSIVFISSEILVGVLGKYKTYENYKVYKLTGDHHELYHFVRGVSDIDDEIIIQQTPKITQILIPPKSVECVLDEANSRNITSELKINDYSKLISRPNIKNKNIELTWDEYYDISVINAFLTKISETYPDYAKVVDAGHSYEGRSILGLNINDSSKNSGKPAIFIESGIHAREWIAPATITYFINELMTSDDPDIMYLRDNFDWHIFPVVNPDGYQYSFTTDRFWRKTRSKSSPACYGVDANRNWDHNWGKHGSSCNPCNYQTYAGPEPFSEIETKNLAHYISNVENLMAYLGFHADAQILLVPYSDSAEHVDNYDDLVQIGKVSLEYGKKVNNEEYGGPATAAEILYKASGGSMDWVREALGTPLVYTYELRGDFFQWPKERIPEQGDEVTQMILGLMHEASNLGYF